jgi:hypothetical protein
MASFRSRAQVVLVGLPLIVVFGCSDSQVPASVEDFPSYVGSRWVYAAYDSTTGTPDTVTVEVKEEKTVSIAGKAQHASVWLLTSSRGEDWRYVTTHGDTVRIWGGDEHGIQYLEFLYVFPLVVGRKWQAPLCNEAEIVEQMPVNLPGDKIGQGYLVESQGGCLNDYVLENRVFVPDVGLTSAHWTCFGFCWTNETWTLLDFDLPLRP